MSSDRGARAQSIFGRLDLSCENSLLLVLCSRFERDDGGLFLSVSLSLSLSPGHLPDITRHALRLVRVERRTIS